MADISSEIQAFLEAAYGEDVRRALVSAMNKINGVAEAAEQKVEESDPVTYASKVDALEDAVDDIVFEIEGAYIPCEDLDPETPYTDLGVAIRGQVRMLKDMITALRSEMEQGIADASVTFPVTSNGGTTSSKSGEEIITELAKGRTPLLMIKRESAYYADETYNYLGVGNYYDGSGNQKVKVYFYGYPSKMAEATRIGDMVFYSVNSDKNITSELLSDVQNLFPIVETVVEETV